jgi:simple sugar transport system permease protein
MRATLRKIVASQETGLVVVLVIVTVTLTVLAGSHPDRTSGETVNNFWNSHTLVQTATDASFFAIMAVGATIVIISGGIDLSVGSVIGFTTVFVALAIERLGVPPWLAFVAILVICAAFGAAMGGVIHVFNLPPFIVTLASMFLARGASFLLSTESTPITAPGGRTAIWRQAGIGSVRKRWATAECIVAYP